MNCKDSDTIRFSLLLPPSNKHVKEDYVVCELTHINLILQYGSTVQYILSVWLCTSPSNVLTRGALLCNQIKAKNITL